VQSLFLGVYPLAGLTIILALVTHGPSRLVSEQSYGMLSHIALSVTAYSLFTLAAIQAVLLYFQNRQLKHNYNSLLVRNLPPLQTMESLLFEMVWAGVVMLILAIVTGALFIEDLFAQNLAHKTLFSILSLHQRLEGHHRQPLDPRWLRTPDAGLLRQQVCAGTDLPARRLTPEAPVILLTQRSPKPYFRYLSAI